MSFLFGGPSQLDEGSTLRPIASQQHRRSKSRLHADAAAPATTPEASRSRAASSSEPPARRHIVTPDPVALIYLEDDPSVHVVERRISLEGYELYLVEQWACSRQSPTLVISTYTGDPKHSVVVGVLSVPADEKDWSPQLSVYFKAMQKYHARPKETPFGEIMATNLSSFPSALTVIAVPDGDLGKHRHNFVLNEDLKRLGCSGRSALTLLPPTRATQDKFASLYKTSDKVPLAEAVLGLISMCQTALYTFGLLQSLYTDGLLCDLTERAINDWWTDVGVEYYNVEPADGILGPTTVAALLGMLMGARNRLAWYGAPVGKDVFDLEATAKGIDSFQKAMKLERTRRLDHQTLRRLHTVSAKAAAGEVGWGVQKAVKSTVEGFGGKRGEIVIGMVGGKDRANIGDIETVDMDKFVSLIYGERPKWLWHGKTRRAGSGAGSGAGSAGNAISEDVLSPISARQLQGQCLDLDEATEGDERAAVYLGAAPESAVSVANNDGVGERDAKLRKTVFRSVAGKVSDARSGLGRIRDAVGGGLRGHSARPSRDELGAGLSVGASAAPSSLPSGNSSSMQQSPPMVGRAFTWKNKPEEYLSLLRKEGSLPYAGPAEAAETSRGDEAAAIARASILAPTTVPGLALPGAERAGQLRRGVESTAATAATSAVGSVADEADLQGPFAEAEKTAGPGVVGLLRRHSLAVAGLRRERPSVVSWLRRMSFSAAEEAVLRWDEIVDMGNVAANSAQEYAALTVQRCLYERMADLRDRVGPHVMHHVRALEALEALYGQQADEAQGMLGQLAEACERLQHSSDELVGLERAQAGEAVREVEMLMAKVEYEIGALASKVQDVEDGVRQFAEQVDSVERRADELKRQLETESWLHWLVRTLTGIGTGPNIIRGQ